MNFRSVLSVLLKMAIGFVALCGIIVALGFWALDPLNFRAPKDQDLISLFHDLGQVERIEQERSGVIIYGNLPGRLLAQFQPFLYNPQTETEEPEDNLD